MTKNFIVHTKILIGLVLCRLDRNMTDSSSSSHIGGISTDYAALIMMCD